MSEYTFKSYYEDKIRAVDAKFEAQKITFAPIAFQAARALLEMEILKNISDSGDEGLTLVSIAEKAGISVYGARVLMEMALGLNLVKVLPGDGEARFVLGKTGWFLLEDEMTKVNFSFVNNVCYKGAFELPRSIKAGKPLGLEVFGYNGKTIYEVLSSLPEPAKTSWFKFDHFYSDIGFEEALPIVFAGKPAKIVDIGGNTAKWAICCCRYDPTVEVLIVDLPGQTATAEGEIAKASFSGRIKTFSCNILKEEMVLPGKADIIWMSQFLDCFSPEEIIHILKKVRAAAGPDADVYILEPFEDMQRFEAASFLLQATSLYFTCMANGNSKFYSLKEFSKAIAGAGFVIAEAWHNLGPYDYSLLRCRSGS